MDDFSWVTGEMFDRKLEEIIKKKDVSLILTVPDVYEALSEYFNNDVLDELSADREEKEGET
jgi:hypothetical protein